MSKELGITVKKNENFSEWYIQVVLKAELADYSPVQGCMIIKPYGYAIWERISKELDKKFRELGVKNVYFPIFIPERLLKKEAEHFEGFVPECAWVTIGGESELGERLAVRPTSETIMYQYFSKWIRSYRDLPLLINQWCNVVRWESSTKFFVRTTEFLWQEGHTAHSTKAEAEEWVKQMLLLYKKFIEEYLAIPVLIGKKSEGEKFRGAEYTLTLEALMPDGRIIQVGTSHLLGQKFSRPFEIKFQDKDGQWKYVWQTSWGVSTRLIGALVMTHGDDKGLILPPRIAPVQVIIIPIYYNEEEREMVIKKCKEIKEKLKAFEVEVDEREEYTPGYKFNEWELKGVPIRLEVGPKDLEEGKVVIFRRDTGEKLRVDEKKINEIVKELSEKIQKNLLEKAKLNLKIRETSNWEEFIKLLEDGGFIKSCWCGRVECEEEIKKKTGATVRLIPLVAERLFSDKCIHCGSTAKHVAYFGKAY